MMYFKFHQKYEQSIVKENETNNWPYCNGNKKNFINFLKSGDGNS